MIIPCECGAKLKVNDAKIPDKGVKVRCPRCGNVLHAEKAATSPHAMKAASDHGAPSSLPLVLIAHESDMIRKMIGDVLLDSGFQVDMAVDGVEALKKAMTLKPRGMVLDVGLPGIYGFELCEKLKGDPETASIKIVLLSSVYDVRRYKCTPTSLYGADDYIEKHHIPDYLPVKLRKLMYPEQFMDEQPKIGEHFYDSLPERSRPPERKFEPSLLSPVTLWQGKREFKNIASTAAGLQEIPSAAPEEGTALTPESFSLDASIFQKEECNIPRVDEEDPEAVEKARRFARIIVSDIALYNQEAVVEGLKNNTFYDLLKDDVAEGRELYERRVPGVIKAKKDYYQEAFDNFIAAAKRHIAH